MVVEAGHEIGAHGYAHENPIAMTPQQEEEVLRTCVGLIERVAGRRPAGYVAPWWEFSNVTNELLLQHGFKYDHSLMHNDFHPYYVRVGDHWTKIDYARSALTWMQPLVRGHETGLIEIPANWYLDDLPTHDVHQKSPNSHGFVDPRTIEQLWRDQFDWVYREYDYAVFTMTIHPDVSGRPQVLLMHERLIDYINQHEGVRWMTFEAIADDFARRSHVLSAHAIYIRRTSMCVCCAGNSSRRAIGLTSGLRTTTPPLPRLGVITSAPAAVIGTIAPRS